VGEEIKNYKGEKIMEKTFYSIEAVEKYYFPKQYKRKREEELIERIGFGAWLARIHLAFLRKKLKGRR